jgi:hypothetical protein
MSGYAAAGRDEPCPYSFDLGLSHPPTAIMSRIEWRKRKGRGGCWRKFPQQPPRPVRQVSPVPRYFTIVSVATLLSAPCATTLTLTSPAGS